MKRESQKLISSFSLSLILTLLLFCTKTIYSQNNRQDFIDENPSAIVESTIILEKSSDNSDQANPETNSFIARDRITDDWWGARNIFEQSGLEVSFDYTGEIFSNRKGGLEQKTDYLHNINLAFNFDLEQMLNWEGASMNVYFLGNKGGVPGDAAGTSQGISNIAAHDTWKLYEFWIQQNLFEDRLSLLAGLFDLNSEFDARESSALFINPSHGIGPDYAQSGLNGPSIFSTTSLAFRALYQVTKNAYILGAVFDGVPGDPENPNATHISLSKEDGALIAGEFGIITNSGDYGEGYSKIALGGWYYTSEFEAILQPGDIGSPAMVKGNYGLYAFAEKFLYAEPGNEEQGLAGFVRAGIADKNVNQFDFYFGSGLTYNGLIEGRENDIAGIAVALAKNGSPFIKSAELVREQVSDFEMNIELTFAISLLPWLMFQPDIQYVVNPGTMSNVENAFVFGTRLVMVF